MLSKAGIEASSQSCEALLARRPVAGLYCVRAHSPKTGGWGFSYVVAVEVVDVGLGEHGVVLELRLAERRGVASNDDELGLAAAESLEGRLVSEGDCGDWVSIAVASRAAEIRHGGAGLNTPLPDFITSARRELMESEVLVFLGAISALQECVCRLKRVLGD